MTSTSDEVNCFRRNLPNCSYGISSISPKSLPQNLLHRLPLRQFVNQLVQIPHLAHERILNLLDPHPALTTPLIIAWVATTDAAVRGSAWLSIICVPDNTTLPN